MKKLLVILSVLTVNSVTMAQAAKTPQEIINSILPSIIDSSANGIKTKGCKLQKEKWALILISKEEFKETIKFNETCDLQGSFTVKMDKFFPIKLELRGLSEFSKLATNAKINLSFTDKDTLLRVDLTKSTLTGKQDLVFNLDYTVAIDPFAQPIIKKHIGGKLFVKNFGGQKLYKTYPLKFK